MGLIGLAVLGVVLGAAGSEWLRANNPELIKKVRNAAKGFVDSFCSSKPDNKQADKEEKGDKTL
jgi:hypothetical protein